jgi:CRISPR/Cas system CSM-associated protein Csm4 (group 5 of RAMP superfamily)
VDFIYHSDSLYSAITSAMAQLGSLDEWLSATARAASPAVCFSSCFPFLDEIGFVVPPRTIWPPASPALMAARIRWKSARFVPLGIVQALLAGRTLNEHHWSVDGASRCLVPAGQPGPFRTDSRWNAAVDRLTGATERHSTACLEFRPGAGLWTVVSFLDEAALGRWLDPVKAAFRLLADSGFGGERSRGWGRSETPEFIEGQLPDMILPPAPAPAEVVEASVEAPSPIAPMVGHALACPPSEIETPEPEAAAPELVAPEPTPLEIEPTVPPELTAKTEPPEPVPVLPEPEQIPLEIEPPVAQESATEAAAPEPVPVLPEPEPIPLAIEPPVAQEPAAETAAPEPAPEPPAPESTPVEVAPASVTIAASQDLHHHWLLSLFSPAPNDAIDWTRGNYSVLTRGGRVESPAGSGELKKQVQMVAEGSVVYAGSTPTGAAPDVAPDGFAHPVFRAGFALAIPLPGGRS